MGSVGVPWSCADNFGVLARGADFTNVHLACLIAGVQKAGLDVHDVSLTSGSGDLLGCEVSPATTYFTGTGKRISRIRSVARTVSSRRPISGRAIEVVSGHASSVTLSNRGALSLLDSSFKFARRRFGFPESRGQLCVWNKEHLEEFSVFSAVIGVFAGLMFVSVRMHRKRASRSRFVKDVASWLRKLGRVSEWTMFKSSSRSIGARSRARRSIVPEAGLECSSSDDDVSRADFPVVSLQLLDPSGWTLTAHGGFFREENIVVLEARSILYPVRYAENCYPRGRLLIVSDNLALVLALCKGRSKFSTLLQSCVGSLRLVSEQVLSYRTGGYRQS